MVVILAEVTKLRDQVRIMTRHLVTSVMGGTVGMQIMEDGGFSKARDHFNPPRKPLKIYNKVSA
jgi:hypothetical protein